MRPILLYLFGEPVPAWHFFFALAIVLAAASFAVSAYFVERSAYKNKTDFAVEDSFVDQNLFQFFAIVYFVGLLGARD